MNSISSFFLFIILSLVCVFPKLCGQSTFKNYQIDTVSFKYSETDKNPFLVFQDSQRIEIPGVWLYPPEELQKDEDSYVSSFNYLEQITSFKIGKELLGLHLSSWDYMPPGTGSAMAASGRDIFLIYNKKTRQISPGIINNGITKERVRSMGCFYAIYHDYIIGDINKDGLTDIGVTLEKIWCNEESDEEQGDFIAGPYYKKYQTEWYIFKGNEWKKESKYNGIQVEKAVMKLPMIGLIKSPVDFVRDIYKNKLKEIK